MKSGGGIIKETYEICRYEICHKIRSLRVELRGLTGTWWASPTPISKLEWADFYSSLVSKQKQTLAKELGRMAQSHGMIGQYLKISKLPITSRHSREACHWELSAETIWFSLDQWIRILWLMPKPRCDGYVPNAKWSSVQPWTTGEVLNRGRREGLQT